MMPKDQTSFFVDHIQERATQYFPDLQSSQIEVRFEEMQQRRASILYRFTVSDKVQNHGILVKVPIYCEPSPDEANGGLFSKPSLFPRTELKDKYMLEGIALRGIYEYFTNLDEKQLRAISVHDYLPEHRAVLLEYSSASNLLDFFLKTSRLYFSALRPRLDLVFQNVGKWLRYFHAMPKENHVKTRSASRDEYIEGGYQPYRIFRSGAG